MKTRTTKKATANGNKSSQETPLTATPAQTLEPSVANPPQVFVLPKNISAEARVITLPNFASSTPSRYLICPEQGACYEFIRVAGPKRACRSWLLAPEQRSDGSTTEINEYKDQEGYLLQTPDLLIATPIDPLFLVLPALMEDSAEMGGREMYLSPSDYLSRLEERSAHFKALLRHEHARSIEQVFETRILAVCDSVDTGEEKLHKLSRTKLLRELIEKAKRMVAKGLPASMEEHFVKQALAVPLLSVRREESGVSVAVSEHAEAESETAISQDSTTTASSASTAATSVSVVTAPAEEKSESSAAPSDEIAHLLRLRTALNFMLSSYVPATLRSSLLPLLEQSEPGLDLDFTPLTTHLAHLSALKQQAQALRSISDNISRKRSAADDEEGAEKAMEKKRKKEEEEIKKKNMSRAVQALKKADRSGMQKLSSFFGAKGKG